MPTTNARGHVIPTGTEASFNRNTIFSSFGNSIRDIVPVANTTARTSLVTALTNAGQGPSATRPLVVYRNDAPGLHRHEYTTDGTVWLPLDGVLYFASKSAADTFATSYGSLLTIGDEARVGRLRYEWDGTAWRGWIAATLQNGWTNYGGNYAVAEYRNAAGITYGRGSIASGTTAPGTLLFTLPTGYRPGGHMVFKVWSNGTAPDAGVDRTIEVLQNGNVVVGSSSISAARTDITFQFPADQ